MLSLSLSLSAPILSISTCSNTRVAPHLEVTAEKIRGDNCILSLHIILEPQKVNFSWIFINHRRIQTTCYVPLWCLQLFFPPPSRLLCWWQRAKAGSVCFKNTIICCTTSAKNHKACSINMRHIHRDKELKSISIEKQLPKVGWRPKHFRLIQQNEAVKPLVVSSDSSPKRKDYNNSWKDQVGQVIQSSYLSMWIGNMPNSISLHLLLSLSFFLLPALHFPILSSSFTGKNTSKQRGEAVAPQVQSRESSSVNGSYWFVWHTVNLWSRLSSVRD